MKKSTKRSNQNTTTPRENEIAKDVDTTRETTQRRKGKENEKVDMGKNNIEANEQAENLNYINSYLTEIFDLAKSDESVSSKEDGNVKGTPPQQKSSELGETISRLHTKNNSFNVEWDLDNTYEFETMESGSYPNGDVQLVEAVDVVEVVEVPNAGEVSAGASYTGGGCEHGLRLKKALTSVDERDYNIFGTKSLFNHFGSFNRSGSPGVWLTKDEEMYNATKGQSVQNGVGVCMKMAEGTGDLLIDEVVRGSCPMEQSEKFDMLEEDAFHNTGGSSVEHESDRVNVELLLAQLAGSNEHVDGVDTVQTGKSPHELNKNLFELLSSSNREFICDYIRKYREVEECGDGTSGEGNVQGQNAPHVDGYEKGKSVCFDLLTQDNSIMLNEHDIGTYVKRDRGKEAGIGFKSESFISSGENIHPSGGERDETSRHNVVNQDNCAMHHLGGMAHPAHTNGGEYKKEGYEHTDSNAPSLFFIPAWVGYDQGETCMQGRGLDKEDTEGKRSTTTPPNHVAPADAWHGQTPSVRPNVKECTTSELYDNLLELLNDGSHNVVKVDNVKQEIGMHSGEDFISGNTAAYYHGDILKHMTHEGGRYSHPDDDHNGANDAFTRRANYEAVRNYAHGLSGVDDVAEVSEVGRGVTMGNISNTALPMKSYLKYPTAPFPILHDNAQGTFRNGGQSTHGSQNKVAKKKKNIMFEALKNKIGFLLQHEDDEVSLSEYIMDAISDYNRSKWGTGASGRERMEHVSRPSFGEGDAGLYYNPVGGGYEIPTRTDLQTCYARQGTQNGIPKSETINYNCSGASEHRHTTNLPLGRAHTDLYNDRYSQMDPIRGRSPPQGLQLEGTRQDKWRADNSNGGVPHVRNRTQRSSIANLKLFLENSLLAHNMTNSRSAQDGAVGAVGVAVEAGIPSGHMDNYTSGQRNSLSKGSFGGDSAFGPNGYDIRARWNSGLMSTASPPLPVLPVKEVDGRNSANVGSFHWGDYSIEPGDAIREQVGTANKEEDKAAQLRKINENLLLLSRRNSRSLRTSDVSTVEQERSAAQDGSANGHVLPLHGGNSLMRNPEGARRDNGLAHDGDDWLLKRDSANLTIHGAFGGGVGTDLFSGVVGSFEKGHFIDDEVGSNWSSWNFKGRERGIEEAKTEGILFGGRRRDPSLRSGGKGAFEDHGNNSLWNRNVASGSSATRGSNSRGSGVNSGRGSGVNSGRGSGDRNGRVDRSKSEERRGMSNTRGKKKSSEARDQLSAEALKACLSKKDEQDLEHLLKSLYEDRIIPLVINLKGRAEEYNLRDVIKNNITNAYGLFPEKYTVTEHHPRSPSSAAAANSPPAAASSPENCLVHFAHRKVDDDYFFSINDSVDRYDATLWNQFEKYLLEIASSDDPQVYSFTGGRYGMAKELQRRKLPFFQGLYLGHLCHIVHISATRKIIAYENNFIKPISQCKKYEDAKMGILNTRGGNAKNYISSMEELKFYLGAILKTHKRGINISTLKGKMMSNYNKRLCESVFHCVKLVELLQMEELRDVCVVDLESRVLRGVVAR
ncbi:hypothetical protein AK88_00510 [Plasmodium fragile]|uniref:HTH OST-type domain-containing protein n=1 Tax=Plasmodium fragile TaxID=5857 RepID=A0A0D9QSK2_PLAFR|nr:uncharacterized protein AK88_00510 [Plasmodium fragile]KJP89802.1 hypothetical protein AK88_00510 [Plasmodium fragile]